VQPNNKSVNTRRVFDDYPAKNSSGLMLCGAQTRLQQGKGMPPEIFQAF
jgi:hypothetical protein